MNRANAGDHIKLEANARSFTFDPVLDRAADLFHTDREAWNRLPRTIQSLSDVYADLRRYYRDAVYAGVIADDRSPAGDAR